MSIQNFGINKAVGGTSYLPSTNFVPPEAIVMNRLVFCIIVLFLAFFNPSMRAAEPTQEAQRNLGNTNSHSKFLTAGEVDNWVLECKANEVLIVHVTTTQFDAVLGLAKASENQDRDGEQEKDEVLFSVDEDGSKSHFRHRIKEAGTYKIRIHGYQMKGGGDYQLTVQRFLARPAEIGKKIQGRFDDKGRASFFFDASPNQHLAIGNFSTQVFDENGQPVSLGWNSTLLVKKQGEHLVSFSGRPKKRFTFFPRAATTRNLDLNEPQSIETQSGALNTWEFMAKPGQFRVVTVSRSSNHAVQLVMAPVIQKKDKSLLKGQSSSTPMRFLPVASKGESTKYAVVFGVAGKFQLQTYSTSSSLIDIKMIDPTREVKRNESSDGNLALGDAVYYGFTAKPGDVVKMSVTSKTFDSVLRLFDQTGQRIAENDDFKESRDSQITQVITKKGFYRWQITSLGNGGGGQYDLSFNEIEKKQLAVGRQTKSKINANSTHYWDLSSDDRKPVFIELRSSSCHPQVRLYDNDGRHLKTATSNGNRSQLIVWELSPDQPVTIWVANGAHGGSYEIRVLDAEWGTSE